MAKSTGKAEVNRYFDRLPDAITKVLRGAGRAAATVVADEIKARTWSDDVREDLRIRSKLDAGLITVTIDVKPGWGRSIANWAEYGTSPHFITVDDAQRDGRGIGRVNRQLKDSDGNASLVINGKFVGATVFHPGARPEPVFRPALDSRGNEAIATAQSYITSRVTAAGLNAAAEPEGVDT